MRFTVVIYRVVHLSTYYPVETWSAPLVKNLRSLSLVLQSAHLLHISGESSLLVEPGGIEPPSGTPFRQLHTTIIAGNPGSSYGIFTFPYRNQQSLLYRYLPLCQLSWKQIFAARIRNVINSNARRICIVM